MQSLRGQLILDGGKLAGSPFQHTVVLICSHDPEGAFGLVLNRPTEEKMEDCLAETLPESMKMLPLYLGGPVRRQALTCLIHDPANDDTTEETVLPGLRFTHNLSELLEPGGDLAPSIRVKFFAGYAGWAPGQLDSEMKEGAWLTHPASLDLVFHSAPEQLWKTILRVKGPGYRLLAESPEDVSHN